MDLKIDESVILNAQQMEQMRSGSDVGEVAETGAEPPEGTGPAEAEAAPGKAGEEIFGELPDIGSDELSDFSAPTVMMTADLVLVRPI